MLPAGVLLLLVEGADGTAAGESTCPRAEEVRELVVDDRVRAADFRIEDLGPRFVLRAGGDSRLLEEPAHDCAARAKMAAVVLTSMLAPPYAEDRAPQDVTRRPPVPPSPVPPAPRPAPHESVVWLAGVGPTLEVAPGVGGRSAFLSAGLSARGGFTTARPGGGFAGGATFGAALFAPATFAIGPTYARMVRATFDLSAHIQGDAGPLTFRGALGPALDLHDIRGSGADGQGDFRKLLGVRAAAETLVPLSKTWSTSLELSALFVPGPGDLALHSVGVVGQEPAAYLGVTLRIWAAP